MREALSDYPLKRYFKVKLSGEDILTAYEIREHLERGEMEPFFQYVARLYSGLPYSGKEDIYAYENTHRNIFYCILWTLNIMPIPEDVSHKGRADLSFTVGKCAYVLEFKVSDKIEEGKGSDALNQIKNKEYHGKYEGSCEKIIIAGIEYGVKDRRLAWKWERVK